MARTSKKTLELTRAQLKIQELYPDLTRQYITAYCQSCRFFTFERCYYRLFPVTFQGDPCPYYVGKGETL